MKKKVYQGLLLLGIWSFVCTSGYADDLEEYPLGRGMPGVAVLFGGSFEHSKWGWDNAPAFAVRYYFARRYSETAGPESLSPWSVEVGIIPEHSLHLTGIAREVSGASYKANPTRMGSQDISVQYRWALLKPIHIYPDISLGLTFAQIENEISGFIPSPTSYFFKETQTTHAIAPFAKVGLPLLANDVFSFRMEVGYTYLPSEVSRSGQSFDLTMSGIGIYPSVQVHFGHLQSEVQKGVYLPPSALPLWAITALRTEKKSPIIAPPEVLLNSQQRQSQGGLSGNVLFQYKSKRANRVEIMGDFNQWVPEPLYMDKDHVWITVKDLPTGVYRYTFLINGKREVRDPWNTSVDLSQRPHGCSMFVVSEVLPKN